MSVCTFPDETVTVTHPDFPFDASTAEEPPLGLIVAMLPGEALHVSGGVFIVAPFVSSARTVSVIELFVCITGSTDESVTTSVSSVAGGDGGGGGVAGAGTVTVAVPLCPSLVAVMVTVPAATAVTTPEVVTVAIFASLVDQVTTRPDSVFPLASRVVAVRVADEPTATCDDAGVTTTDATGTGAGAFTVICALPVFPSLVAVIVAVPAAFAVTTPLVLTVAVCGALDAHTMLRPASVLPLPSYVIAVSVIVAPTVSVPVVGATATDATAIGVTVTVALALFPSLVAEMVALPAASAVMLPLLSTLTICGALDVHATARPASGEPLPSYVIALNVPVAPMARFTDEGATVMDATGTAVTDSVAMAECPSALAAICAVPIARAVTTPDADTVATVVSELDQ